MERTNYNIKKLPNCIWAYTWGPIDRTTFRPFIGNNIYKEDVSMITKKVQDLCDPLNTIIDYAQNPTFNLPLDQYYKLNPLR